VDRLDADEAALEVRVMLGSSEIRLNDGERAERSWQVNEVQQALEVLASIEEWLPALLAGLPAAKLRERREGCGAFSLLEHVWHLHDIDELGYLQRVRRTLAVKRPQLADVDGDRLAIEGGYQKRSLHTAQRDFLRARRKALVQLRGLKEIDFRREATLEGTGLLTLGDLVLRWRTHDLGHRVEMERLAKTLRR
jgi:hypothetical protein